MVQIGWYLHKMNELKKIRIYVWKVTEYNEKIKKLLFEYSKLIYVLVRCGYNTQQKYFQILGKIKI